MNILIAIPCYNCEKQVKRVFSSLKSLNPNINFEIAFIDNCSSDHTVSVLKDLIRNNPLSHRCSVYSNDENYGLGGTHKVAFNLAREKDVGWVLILHGDDQATISDVESLVLQSQRLNCSVLGSRFSSGSKRIGYQRSRVVGNMVLNLIFSLITFKKTKDLGSGINLFNLKDIEAIDYINLSDNFNFNVELLLSFYSFNIPHRFSPITWTETDQVSNARNFKVALSMLNSLLRWRLSFSQRKNSKVYRSICIASID